MKERITERKRERQEERKGGAAKGLFSLLLHPLTSHKAGAELVKPAARDCIQGSHRAAGTPVPWSSFTGFPGASGFGVEQPGLKAALEWHANIAGGSYPTVTQCQRLVGSFKMRFHDSVRMFTEAVSPIRAHTTTEVMIFLSPGLDSHHFINDRLNISGTFSFVFLLCCSR